MQSWIKSELRLYPYHYDRALISKTDYREITRLPCKFLRRSTSPQGEKSTRKNWKRQIRNFFFTPSKTGSIQQILRTRHTRWWNRPKETRRASKTLWRYPFWRSSRSDFPPRQFHNITIPTNSPNIAKEGVVNGDSDSRENATGNVWFIRGAIAQHRQNLANKNRLFKTTKRRFRVSHTETESIWNGNCRSFDS